MRNLISQVLCNPPEVRSGFTQDAYGGAARAQGGGGVIRATDRAFWAEESCFSFR